MTDDHPIFELHPEIVADVTTGLAQKEAVRAATAPDGHAVAGAGFTDFVTITFIEATVRAALEMAAQTFGSTGVALTLAHKEQIRSLIGPKVLDYCDTIIHGLQDVKVAPQGS